MPTLLEIALSNALVATSLAVLAAGVAYWYRRPALTHGLWLLVLLKLITPPLVPISVPWPQGVDPEPTPPAAQAELTLPETPVPTVPAPGVPAGDASDTVIVVVPTAPPATAVVQPTSPLRWPYALVGVWIAGSVLWLAWTATTIIRFRRVLRHARPAPSQLQQAVQRLAQRLGLRTVPSVWLVPGAVSPMVWALGLAPRLLFPSKLLDCLDDEQRRTLLAHELAHVRRHDHWVRLLELLVTSLYWWHPIVWWARREIHEAEEHCCDAWVVSTLDGAERTYALALLQVLAFVSKARAVLPATASGIGQVPHLRRRLTMICQTKTPRSLSWTGWAALCGMGLLLLPVLPTPAQQPPADDPAPQQDQVEQQRIEKAVRRALEYLEQEQQGQPTKGKTLTKKNSKAIQQARADMEKARASFEQARAQLEKAQARLAKLEGRPYTSTGSGFFFKPVEVTGQNLNRVWVYQAQANGKPQVRQVEVKPGQAQNYRFRVIQAQPSTKPGQVQRYEYRIIGQPGANKGGSVEERLEQLQHEIEQLRQELKGHKTSGSTPQLRWRVVPPAPTTSTPPAALPAPPVAVSVSRVAPAASAAASNALPTPAVSVAPARVAGAAPSAVSAPATPATPTVRPASALPGTAPSAPAKP